MNRGRIVSSLASLLILLTGGWGVLHARDIQDWWFLRSYQPSSAVSKLATKAQLSDDGKHYFYLGDPQIVDRTRFGNSCPADEHTIVLGCYDGQQIFVRDVDSKELESVEPVTAAHEMLHALYDRLSGSERAELDGLLEAELKTVKNERMLKTIANYRKSDPSSLNNELHSIFGTEKAKLSDQLEEHYAKYFANRAELVDLAEEYENIFVSIERQTKELFAQLESLRGQIESLERQLGSERQDIEAERARMDSLLESGRTSEYNAAVDNFNASVNSYNSKVGRVQALVQQHNQLRERYQQLALRQNSLVEDLKSSATPLR